MRVPGLSLVRGLAVIGACFAAPVSAATLVVTTAADLSGSLCANPCSLRQAINAANLTSAADVIEFDIPNQDGDEIVLGISNDLPAITQPLAIDGYSQDGALANTDLRGSNAVLKIRLDNRGSIGNAINLCASNSSVRGLSITGFGTGVRSAQIAANGCPVGPYSNVVIAGNFIGLRTDGYTATTVVTGIGINDAAATIGGAALADRNVIVSSSVSISIQDESGTVLNNLIGTERTGREARSASSSVGVAISGDSVAQVGTAGAPNLIAFGRVGVMSQGSATATAIHNQYVGQSDLAIDLAADGPTPNDANDVDSGPNGLQNYPVLTLAERGSDSLRITGTLDRPAGAAAITYTLTAYAQSSCGAFSRGRGSRLLGTTNFTLLTGAVEIFNVVLNDVGTVGTQEQVSVVVTRSNDTSEMSECVGVSDAPSALTVTNTADTGAGSLRQAIIDANANVDANVIRFNIPGSGPHIISLNSALPDILAPVLIDGYTQPGSQVNTAAVDFSNAQIRVELTAGVPINNGLSLCSDGITIRGLSVYGFVQTNIGPGAGGGGTTCVAASQKIRILGNFLGLRSDGSASPSISATSLRVINSAVQVGSEQPADRNAIGGATSAAIGFTNATVAGSTVDGNLIGIDPATGADRNDGNGINLGAFATGVTVGAAAPNFIAHNNRGVSTTTNSSSGNRLGGNRMAFNEIPIDLNGDGPTPNDINDLDAGPNDLQNFPVLLFVELLPSSDLRIFGRLDVPVPSNERYTLHVWRGLCSAGVPIQMVPTGSVDHTFAQLGSPTFIRREDFAFQIPSLTSFGDSIVMTATNADGSTSEMSPCIPIATGGQLFRNGFE